MRISKRGQITIPKHLRERFGLYHDVEVEVIPTNDGLLIHRRSEGQHPVDRVYGILGKDALGKGVSVDDYVEEIRDDDNGSGYKRLVRLVPYWFACRVARKPVI